jgi:hypothetical protein
MLVLTLGSGWMRGRIMVQGVIVKCIVAVDAIERFGQRNRQRPFPNHGSSTDRVTEVAHSRNPQQTAQRCRLALFLATSISYNPRTFGGTSCDT